jgi:glycogen debranching enzyme
MTVFGRDSLLTGWMALIADHTLARGVLDVLARFQGADVDDRSEEEPGKILHEMRFGTSEQATLAGGDVYYGSIDATPLFVMLLGELRLWDPGSAIVDQLLPHADRAIAWIEQFGDLDGDGYVEYRRKSERGLANQGWKDSWDAVRHADGTFARPPIALCEVQGYVYAAYVARAHLARDAGDHATFAHCMERATTLRRRFNEDFWLDERGTFALALDADKRPVDAVASNVGHCLWTGIVDPERAAAVADRLLDDTMFSGWGIRTLSSSMRAYNPVSYHNGSVWPHDNALTAAGLMRYGFVEHAHRVITAQLDVAASYEGRLPELFAGFRRDALGVPASYPTSCSPQAWAAAAPLLWLRTMLRLDPWAPRQRLWLDPALPPAIRRLHVEGISIDDGELTIDIDGDDVDIAGLDGYEVVAGARPPHTSLFEDPSG